MRMGVSGMTLQNMRYIVAVAQYRSVSRAAAALYMTQSALSAAVFKFLPGALASIPFFQVGLPAVLSLYFDIFSSCIQAFIFSMLTMAYVSAAAQ